MKLFVILFLVGYASATLLETFEREARSTVTAFVNGLHKVAPLHIALGVEESEEVQRLERDIKEELKKHIKEAFERTLKRIEDAVANGLEVNPEALKALKDLREKMVNLNIADEEMTEDLKELKSKVDDHLRQILEKMGIIDKRSSDSLEPKLLEGVLGDLSIREIFIKLRNMILEKLDVGAVKNSLAKIVGQGAQKLCEWMTNKGKEKVLNFFDRVLETDEETKKRAAEDSFQEIRDYLENIEKDVDNKLSRFKKWLHDLIGKGLDEAKERLQKVTEIIKEIVSEGKNVSRKGLAEILEYLRQHEDEFGSLYDLRNVIQKILNKKD